MRQELAELEAIAQRIVRRNAANRQDEEEIRKRLPGLRKAGVGPAALERTIHHVFVAGTISRWTVDAAGTGRKKGAQAQDPAVALAEQQVRETIEGMRGELDDRLTAPPKFTQPPGS